MHKLSSFVTAIHLTIGFFICPKMQANGPFKTDVTVKVYTEPLQVLV